MIKSIVNITDVSCINIVDNEIDILPIQTINYFENELGSGGFGDVFKVESINGIQTSKYVLKIISNNEVKDHSYETISLLHNKIKKALINEEGSLFNHYPELLGLPFLVCKAYDEIDDKFIADFSKNTKEQIKFLSETIDGFRDFFNPSKHKRVFEIKDAINKSLTLMGNQFKVNEVKLDLSVSDEKVYGVETELEQVILNILSNSIDAFKERKIENRQINIKVFTKEDYTVLIMEDNAGGVNEESIEKIFDPYFTTKSTGTGTGLYMVKLVIKNSFQGDLKINNSEYGLRYIIALPKEEI